MKETIYSQHGSFSSDNTRNLGIDPIPGRSSMECLPRKIAYPHSRWSDRWKRYRRTVAKGTFGAKYSKGQISEAVWQEINKA